MLPTYCSCYPRLFFVLFVQATEQQLPDFDSCSARSWPAPHGVWYRWLQQLTLDWLSFLLFVVVVWLVVPLPHSEMRNNRIQELGPNIFGSVPSLIHMYDMTKYIENLCFWQFVLTAISLAISLVQYTLRRSTRLGRTSTCMLWICSPIFVSHDWFWLITGGRSAVCLV